MDIELKHTWRISRKAWYIRLYLWVWGGNEEQITFCKLWWSYVFMWVGLPIQSLIVGTRKTITGIKWTSRHIGRGLRYSGRTIGKGLAFLDRWGHIAILLALGQIQAAQIIYRGVVTRETQLAPVPQLPPTSQVDARPIFAAEHGNSAVGEFLKNNTKAAVQQAHPGRLKRLFTRTRSEVVVNTTVPETTFMYRMLERITTGAAWGGMQKEKVSHVVSIAKRRFMARMRNLLISPTVGYPLECCLMGYEFVRYDVYRGAKKSLFKLAHGAHVVMWFTIDYVIKPFVKTIALIVRTAIYIVEHFAKAVAWVSIKLGLGIWALAGVLAMGVMAVWSILTATFPVLQTVGNSVWRALQVTAIRPGAWVGRHILWPPLHFTFGLVMRLEGVSIVVALALASVMAIGYIVAFVAILASVIHQALSIPSLVFVGIGITWGVAILGFVLAWLTTKLITRYLAPAIYHAVLHPAAKASVITVGAAEQSAVGFGKIMLIGFKAVKSNTCPKVEIEK